MLVAHCKALEARGPIASHSAGPPDPAVLLLALEGQASSAVTRRLPACTSILTDTSTTKSGSMSVKKAGPRTREPTSDLPKLVDDTGIEPVTSSVSPSSCRPPCRPAALTGTVGSRLQITNPAAAGQAFRPSSAVGDPAIQRQQQGSWLWPNAPCSRPWTSGRGEARPAVAVPFPAGLAHRRAALPKAGQAECQLRWPGAPRIAQPATPG